MSTYTQIHIQTVFSVRNREPLLDKAWRDRLYQYIVVIVQKHGHRMLAIGGTDDHVHMFFGHRPDHALPSLMAEVKRDTSKWINQNRLTAGRFEWQEGYGGFSYSKSDVDRVVRYIANQEKHHANRSYIDELKEFLEKFGVRYDEKYLA